MDPLPINQIICGDNLQVLKGFPDACIDSIVTDPPYGLTANKKGGSGAASVNLDSPYGRARIGTGNGAGGFMGMKWDSDVPSIELWSQCLRVLKPGGHLLAFAGTRTQHRMAARIEDAGFEIRDMIAWLYGSGFPKSLDVSKAIDKAAGAERELVAVGKPVKRMIPGADQNSTGSWIKDNGREFQPTTSEPVTDAAKQWSGWGTALKPAMEPITVARKPFSSTVAANVQECGVGAMNIDACRIATDDILTGSGSAPLKHGGQNHRPFHDNAQPRGVNQSPLGRWPANVIHDGSSEVVELFPDVESGKPSGGKAGGSKNCYGEFAGGVPVTGFGDSGSAARFFYCAKADQSERGKHNTHPTVKPVDLMRYLIRLVTPLNALVLDPFAGSGTTLLAATFEHVKYIGIEINPEYVAIANKRLAQQTLF